MLRPSWAGPSEGEVGSDMGRKRNKKHLNNFAEHSGDGGALGLILSILKRIYNALLRDYVTGRRIEDAYGDRPPPRVSWLLGSG